MTVAAVRTAIVAKLNAVSGIGVVHAYERYSKDNARLKQLYCVTPDAPLLGWFIRRPNTHETGNLQSNTVEVIRWRIQGMMALDDANQSELIFDNLIESVRDAFAQDESLGGVVDQCSEPGNDSGETCIQVDDAGPVMFAGVLCHAARLGLTTVRYLERQP